MRTTTLTLSLQIFEDGDQILDKDLILSTDVYSLSDAEFILAKELSKLADIPIDEMLRSVGKESWEATEELDLELNGLHLDDSRDREICYVAQIIPTEPKHLART